MIELPDGVKISGWSLSHVDYGSHQEPETGGEVTRVSRLGNRTGVNVTLAPMLPDEGRIVVNRLIRAKSEGLRLKWFMNEFDAGNVGAPRVNGAGQGGRVLNIDGLPANYQFKEGQPFSIFQNNRNFIYFVGVDINANASGQIALPISPMIREPTVNNAVINLSQPMIDGYIQGNSTDWEISLAHHTNTLFSIMENK